MDGNNWRAAQGQVQMPGQVIGGESVPPGGMEGGDWRTQLQQDSRQRIVNKIMETLKRHLPFSGQEGLQELKKIAVKFEEKIYTAATSQSDYLRKISLKMLTMETKSQNPMANSLQPNAASNSKNPQDPASLDSSSQTGSETAGDWQEEIYQKIKSMHEMYYPELNEMYQRMAAKLQQHDAHPQQPRNEQLEMLRFLKLMLERLIMFLRTNKNDIQPNHKDKIGGVEKQIVNILNSNRPRKAVPPMQQGQLPQPHMHAMQQSQQQQPQMHSSEGQINSQMQPMNMQGSMMPTQQNSLAQQNNLTQQNNLNNLQHSTLSSGSSVSNFRQNMLNGLSNSNMLQPNSSILNPQYQQLQYQQLRLQQQMQGQQLLQQQQVIKQLMLQLQQQQTSLVQKVTQLHVQPMQQPLQQKQPQLQPLQPHLMQPELFLLKQQQFQRLTRQPLVVQPPQQQILNQQHLKQKLPQETSQNQPELTPENLWDVEKQPLIPKQKTSQKQQSGQKTLPRLKTASLILVVSAVLLLVLVMMLLGVVLGTNQLYWG